MFLYPFPIFLFPFHRIFLHFPLLSPCPWGLGNCYRAIVIVIVRVSTPSASNRRRASSTVSAGRRWYCTACRPSKYVYPSWISKFIIPPSLNFICGDRAPSLVRLEGAALVPYVLVALKVAVWIYPKLL